MAVKQINLKFDLYLSLIFALIILLYSAYDYAPVLIIPVLFISYKRILSKRDITTALILMLISRLIMGPFIPGSNLSFNILNILCNYLPLTIIVSYRFLTLRTIKAEKTRRVKWTILYVGFLFFLSLFHITFAISVFAEEILPIALFLLVVLINEENHIDFDYLLKFFRYSFLACLIIYLLPNFAHRSWELFGLGIVFKEAIPYMILSVFRDIPRNTGFVFDFRILGQLACIYLILLYYLGKTKNYWDVALLSTVCLITFSRGPILILILILIAIYAPHRNTITKRQIVIIGASFMVVLAVAIYSLNNKTIDKFITSFNPVSKENAISQRSAFITYSLDRFYEKPYGNGIGALSSDEANVRVFAGYTNLHKEVPDKVIYNKVGDAYWALSLAEKGIIGFVLMLLSFGEIFYFNRNRISLFFMIGFFINLIGTDIPKQGFFYFVIILIYFGVSQLPQKRKENIALVKGSN